MRVPEEELTPPGTPAQRAAEIEQRNAERATTAVDERDQREVTMLRAFEEAWGNEVSEVSDA